jgi:hypothetical protein
VTKAECECAIRHLCHQWKRTYHDSLPNQNLRFSDFLAWLEQSHPELLRFRSVMPPVDIAEMWFDQEFRQTWRN